MGNVLVGVFIGMFLGAAILSEIDRASAERGFVTIGGQLYVLRPATAEERP